MINRCVFWFESNKVVQKQKLFIWISLNILLLYIDNLSDLIWQKLIKQTIHQSFKFSVRMLLYILGKFKSIWKFVGCFWFIIKAKQSWIENSFICFNNLLRLNIFKRIDINVCCWSNEVDNKVINVILDFFCFWNLGVYLVCLFLLSLFIKLKVNTCLRFELKDEGCDNPSNSRVENWMQQVPTHPFLKYAAHKHTRKGLLSCSFQAISSPHGLASSSE